MANIVSSQISIAITDTLIQGPKTTRGYVGIQNLDAANTVYVSFGRGTATAANGIRIGPGEYLEIRVPGMGSSLRGIAVGGVCTIVLLSDG